jgi:uncharacterized protein YfaS (alpha-2-macroglobulin family)
LYYVGLKTKRYFVQQGQPLKVQAIVTDLDGKAVAGQKIAMTAHRLDWTYAKRQWKTVETEPQTCEVSSANEPATCTFTTPKGGTYVIRASVHDLEGRRNESEITRWVTGGSSPPRHKVEKEVVQIIASKDRYQPGDKAELLIQAPFYPAEGLLTVRQAGLVEQRRFRLEQPTATQVVEIKEWYMPSVQVQVDVVGSAPRLDNKGEEEKTLPRRPAYANGSISLSVPALSRALTVTVTPRNKRIVPGGSTTIDIAVDDAQKKGVSGAEVALVVVDEAVLALTGYRLYSPLGTFYPYRVPGMSDYYLRGAVKLVDPEALAKLLKQAQKAAAQKKEADGDREGRGAMTGAAPPSPAPGAKYTKSPSVARGESTIKNGTRGRGRGADRPPIAIRKDFSALALFVAALPTDAAGKAQVELKLPDSLTRYRITAVAVHGAKYYGSGESSITARQPLMIRPAAPRFLNFGDRFELPVVLQNQTDDALTVSVALRASNLNLTDGPGQTVRVPANDRIEARFPAKTVAAGTARVQIAAVAGSFADAAEISLPVWTPATAEAFATYGTIDQGVVVQPVRLPGGIIKEFGGLEVSTSSTAVQALTDAMLYLYSYPYECSEQVASRVLAVAALRDVLAAFRSSGLPPPEHIEAAIYRDMKKLEGMQNHDGGFSFWRRGYPSWPYLSNHVTHALVRAKAKGFKVPPRMLSQALDHLKRIESYIPSNYPIAVRDVIVAYSLYVRQLAGDRDVSKAKTIYRRLKQDKEQSLESVGWLYPVLSGSPEATAEVSEIRRLLQNRVTETASTAEFRGGYSDGAHLILYSSRRADGLLLEAMIKDQPKSDLIPKLVRGLLGQRKRGRWGNTQENAWVLLALDRYFNTYEKVTPDFVARVWLGERFAGQHAYRGRTTERHEMQIPFRFLDSRPTCCCRSKGRAGCITVSACAMRPQICALQRPTMALPFNDDTKASTTQATSFAHRMARGR